MNTACLSALHIHQTQPYDTRLSGRGGECLCCIQSHDKEITNMIPPSLTQYNKKKKSKQRHGKRQKGTACFKKNSASFKEAEREGDETEPHYILINRWLIILSAGHLSQAHCLMTERRVAYVHPFPTIPPPPSTPLSSSPPGAGASITQAAGRSGGQERARSAPRALAVRPHHYSPPIRHHPDPAWGHRSPSTSQGMMGQSEVLPRHSYCHTKNIHHRALHAAMIFCTAFSCMVLYHIQMF